MSVCPALFLIADDDQEHVTFLRELIHSLNDQHLTLHAQTADEAGLLLASLVLHNPTAIRMPTVAIVAFEEEEESRRLLDWVRAHEEARPQRTLVLTSTAAGATPTLAGSRAIGLRYPKAADLVALLEPVAVPA